MPQLGSKTLTVDATAYDFTPLSAQSGNIPTELVTSETTFAATKRITHSIRKTNTGSRKVDIRVVVPELDSEGNLLGNVTIQIAATLPSNVSTASRVLAVGMVGQILADSDFSASLSSGTPFY